MRFWTPDILKRKLTSVEELEDKSQRKSESKFVIYNPNRYTTGHHQNHSYDDLQVWTTTYDKTLSKTTEFKPDIREHSYNPSTWGTEAGEMW